MILTPLYRLPSRRYFLLAIVFFLLSTHELFAQGSPYEFIGFGTPVVSQSARLEAIACSGVALTDGRMINDLNPAAWSMLTRSRIEVKLNFFYDKSDLGSDEGIKRLIKFSGASFGTLLSDKYNLGFAFGFSPISNAVAEVNQLDSLGTTTYTREGGLSQLYIGLSARPISALNIGARADFLFGNLRSIGQADVSRGVETVPGLFQREYSMTGTRGTFGFLLTLDSLVQELRGLTIAGAYSLGSNLNSIQRTHVTPINSALDSTIEHTGYGYYPPLIRLGLATRFGDRYRAEVDITGQDFSNSTYYSLTKPIVADPQLGTSNRYSIGIERLPMMGDESKGVPFWERVGLRIGASYAVLPFNPLSLTATASRVSVSEISFTAGLGMPMNTESVFDFSLGLGLRSPSIANSAPKELFFKMGASISLSEKWFVPLRRDDD
ncbi:MAG: hypothetical protein WCH46_09500 [bacterium]